MDSEHIIAIPKMRFQKCDSKNKKVFITKQEHQKRTAGRKWAKKRVRRARPRRGVGQASQNIQKSHPSSLIF